MLEDDLILVFKNKIIYDTYSQGYYCQTKSCIPVVPEDGWHGGAARTEQKVPLEDLEELGRAAIGQGYKGHVSKIMSVRRKTPVRKVQSVGKNQYEKSSQHQYEKSSQ
jgi:hypothetical protein